MKVYMVLITGVDMCLHCGVYSTYGGALRQWHRVRREELQRMLDYYREDNYSDCWYREVYLLSADCPEEHDRRHDELHSYSVDRIEIVEYDVED